jgi:hypothetical protein
VKKENVTILIDMKSTHNSIDINVAKRLNLFVYLAGDIRVMVANSKRIDGVEKCHKVKLQIEDYELKFGFYTVPLEGVDIVLGIQWLQMEKLIRKGASAYVAQCYQMKILASKVIHSQHPEI